MRGADALGVAAHLVTQALAAVGVHLVVDGCDLIGHRLLHALHRGDALHESRAFVISRTCGRTHQVIHEAKEAPRRLPRLHYGGEDGHDPTHDSDRPTDRHLHDPIRHNAPHYSASSDISASTRAAAAVSSAFRPPVLSRWSARVCSMA